MATTQVVFNIDSAVKAKAMKRAKKEGITLSAVLKMAAKAFADGEFDVDIEEAMVRPEKWALWERESKKLGRGEGKTFNSAAEAIKYLRSL